MALCGPSGPRLKAETENLLARFPNASVNADEQRRLRAALYRPLLDLPKEDRTRVVDVIVAIILG
jgi:type I restriction enzyme R subunit